MIELSRITGEKLTLVFNPEGGLSSAKLCGTDVTLDFSFIHEQHCKELLMVYGFCEQWDTTHQRIAQTLACKLKKLRITVDNLLGYDNNYLVGLCSSERLTLPFKYGCAVYDAVKNRFDRFTSVQSCCPVGIDELNSLL